MAAKIPLVVSSGKVEQLQVGDSLSDYLKADGSVPLTADWATGTFSIIGSDHWYLRADGARMFFGAGDDASIYFNGTNLVLEPDVISEVVLVQNSTPTGNSILRVASTGGHAILKFHTDGPTKISQFEFSIASQRWDLTVSPTTGGAFVLYDVTMGGQIVMKWQPGNPPYVSMPRDDTRLYWGAANDCFITYDGTNMILEPSSAGNGAVKIQGTAGTAYPLLHVAGTGHVTVRLESTTAARQVQIEFKTPSQAWNVSAGAGNFFFIYDLVNFRYAMQCYPGTPPRIALPNDNSKLSWGVDDDCSILYDGTNMILEPSVVGGGAVRIEGAGGVSNPLLHVVGTDHTIMKFETAGAGKLTQIEFKTTIQLWNFGVKTSGSFDLRDNTNFRSAMTWVPGTPPHTSIPLDDSKLFWGTADDCSIMYDGVDMVVKPDEVGSGGVKVVGDMFFSGAGAGLPYGEIYAYDSATTITISSRYIAGKVQITAFNADGLSNLATPDHTSDHITIVKAGVYLITCSLAVESTGGSGYKVGYGVFLNGGTVAVLGMHAHRDFSSGLGGEHGSISLTGLVDLAVDDTVEVWCWNESGTSDVIIDDANLSITMVGG